MAGEGPCLCPPSPRAHLTHPGEGDTPENHGFRTNSAVGIDWRMLPDPILQIAPAAPTGLAQPWGDLRRGPKWPQTQWDCRDCDTAHACVGVHTCLWFCIFLHVCTSVCACACAATRVLCSHTWFSTSCEHRWAQGEQQQMPPHLKLLTRVLSCPLLSLWVLSLFAGAHWLGQTYMPAWEPGLQPCTRCSATHTRPSHHIQCPSFACPT